MHILSGNLPDYLTGMPGESYHRQLRSSLYLCYAFRALINSLVCWFCTSTLGLIVFQICDAQCLRAGVFTKTPLQARTEFGPMQGRLAQQLDAPKTGTFSCWLVGFRWGLLLLGCLNIEKNKITEISVISTFRFIGFFRCFCVFVCVCSVVCVCV